MTIYSKGKKYMHARSNGITKGNKGDAFNIIIYYIEGFGLCNVSFDLVSMVIMI